MSEHTFDGTRYGMVFFHLFIEQDGVTNTDLSFAGLDVVDNHSHFVQFTNPVPTFANDSSQMKETIPVTGDGVFDENWSVVEGTVTSHQEIKGNPPRGSPIPMPPSPPPLPPPGILPPLTVFTNITVLPPIVLTSIVAPPVIVFTNNSPIKLTNTP